VILVWSEKLLKKITQWDRKRIPGAERAVNVQLTYEDTTDEFGNSPSGEREGEKNISETTLKASHHHHHPPSMCC